MPQATKHFHLKAFPKKIEEIIKKEQMQLYLFQSMDLKTEAVIYHIVEEWYQLKQEKKQAQ